MASSNVSGALREVDEAILVIGPEIVGLESLSNDNLSAETEQFLAEEIERRRRLLGLYRQALEALEALAAEDFPAVEDTVVPAAVAEELAAHRRAIEAAIAGFAAQEPARTLTIALGDPTAKE